MDNQRDKKQDDTIILAKYVFCRVEYKLFRFNCKNRFILRFNTTLGLLSFCCYKMQEISLRVILENLGNAYILEGTAT